MKIIGYALFWSMPGSKTQFHADMFAAKTAQEAADMFRKVFPGDIVRSVRSPSGRFEAFK
jgi:hypothetical protein